MVLQPLVELPPSDGRQKNRDARWELRGYPTRFWRRPACPRREPADRNALRFLRCAARLIATSITAAPNSSGSFGRNGNGGAAPRRARLAMTHAIYSASGSFRQNSRGAIRICRLGSFGHNDILFWLSELFWLGECLAERPSGSFGRDRMRWVAPPRVRSAKFCCGSRNALGSFGQNIPNRSASCAQKGGLSAETLYPLRRKGSHKGLADEASRPDSDGCH